MRSGNGVSRRPVAQWDFRRKKKSALPFADEAREITLAGARYKIEPICCTSLDVLGTAFADPKFAHSARLAIGCSHKDK